jgi:hypothetical protein
MYGDQRTRCGGSWNGVTSVRLKNDLRQILTEVESELDRECGGGDNIRDGVN